MSDQLPERHLPDDVLSKASLCGREYAWRIEDIPEVIEAARRAGLVSLGGQLQFRLPDRRGTCECYWVEVSTAEAPPSLPWAERVEKAAAAAAAGFQSLLGRFDFLAEGRDAFGEHLSAFEAAGGSASDAMWFVWYVLDEDGVAKLGA